MDFTEQTIMEFFRRVGQPSAAYRLMDHLRAKNLMLVPATPLELGSVTVIDEDKKKVKK